jgi:hypothetical protein
MRFKKPTRVSIEQVQITREGDDAIVDHADAGISGAHLAIGPEIATMTDAEIVDLTFNGPVSVPNSSRRSAKPAARISTDSLRLCGATSALPPLGFRISTLGFSHMNLEYAKTIREAGGMKPGLKAKPV